jgi:methionine-rich copper-binding protein CopC
MHARRAAIAALLTLLTLTLRPGLAVAHSQLVSSIPAAGETLTTSPTAITADFSEAVDPGRSTLELRGPDGAQIALGGVPDGGARTQMVIAGVPALKPGVYEVRWTTVTADDNGVERGTFTFAVAAAAASAAPIPSVATTSSPVASPPPEPAAATGAGDVLIPILVLGVVLLVGAALFLRRRP